ncbi:beta-galactosidase [Chytriomyces confervae]|uniref:Beta-galactosidase n=1 Tax=Chytriomyces confervae TaxID=246404 RepID=A0A507EUS0_9FUNG|nr:hypothetical protein HDU80_004998 [Chytriomyces hyalinus]TPX67612.1 beta-galactosidase [Chytriomyces confervae]
MLTPTTNGSGASASLPVTFEVDETSDDISQSGTETARTAKPNLDRSRETVQSADTRRNTRYNAHSDMSESEAETDPLLARFYNGAASHASQPPPTGEADGRSRSVSTPFYTPKKPSSTARCCRAAFFLVVALWAAALMLGFDFDSGREHLPVDKVPPIAPVLSKNVTYSPRAFSINGEPQLLLTATIHYPRSDPSIWPDLLARIKAGGNTAIDTYVFWNLHEPKEGIYDFETGVANLPLFLRLADEAGLHVVLRIGPYVCAEWNYGGFPIWLLDKSGITFRSFNKAFMDSMATFVKKTLDVVSPYLGTNGGPIILLQIENEFGGIANEMGPEGYKYIQWAGEFSQSLNVGLPWFMCMQDNVPTVINAANGFYADSWIAGHRKRFPDQPAMFTELWTGWFQKFGQGKYTRYAEDVAFASARFIARGGTYVAYYMYHGGTNFGRWGSDWKTTTYDYDAPLNEYGFPSNPKYSHLQDLHRVCNDYKRFILHNDPTQISLGSGGVEAHVYGDLSSEALVFLSNPDKNKDATVKFDGRDISVHHWSVDIYLKDGKGLHLLYSTVSVKPSISPGRAPIGPILMPSTANMTISTAVTYKRLMELSMLRSDPETTDLVIQAVPDAISYILEPVGIWNNATAKHASKPLEHIRATRDASDYLWYSRGDVRVKDEKKVKVSFSKGISDVAHVYLDGVKIHDGVIVTDPDSMSSLELEVDLLTLKSKKGRSGNDGKDKSKDKDDGENHRLDVLVGVAGLLNFGDHMEGLEKGILNGVSVDGADITKGEWTHQVGLKGEHLQYFKGSKQKNGWTPSVAGATAAVNSPLVWYMVKFSKHDLFNFQKAALQTQLQAQTYGANANLIPSVRPITAFVLHLGTMSRGLAFVNGHAVGRHWNRKAVCENVPCRYPDSRSSGGGEQCAVGCGYASQSWYNVPTAWILGEGEGDEIEVVVFDEDGGDPLGISIGVIAG